MVPSLVTIILDDAYGSFSVTLNGFFMAVGYIVSGFLSWESKIDDV